MTSTISSMIHFFGSWEGLDYHFAVGGWPSFNVFGLLWVQGIPFKLHISFIIDIVNSKTKCRRVALGLLCCFLCMRMSSFIYKSWDS